MSDSAAVERGANDQEKRMKLKKIGVTSPGDMGQGVAMRLRACGFDVYTALEGRSARTAELAREAGLTDCGSVEKLVATCDAVFSVLNPGAAVTKAREVAAAMRACGKKLVYVDCNAIAPQTGMEIERLIRESGGTFIDAGIIGPPPRGKAKTKLYVSGPEAALLSEAIVDDQLVVRVVGERIGEASAVKMCYASITKGALALGVELLIAARKLGVEHALEAEFRDSQSDLFDWVVNRSVSMPPKAYRWVPEMLEIAKTFQDVGMTPRIMQGAADMYELIAKTPLGRESPEEARERGRKGIQVVQGLADGVQTP
jgi:3-hydroxyisobutyrate dehydrogenase-like beta-hydroxyacid dehydrogenase